MATQRIVIANWKLMRSFAEALRWCHEHAEELHELAKTGSLAICPDLVTMASLAPILGPMKISLGAQAGGIYTSGPHTGSISPRSLREAGCNYVIIGHYEYRMTHSYSDLYYIQSCIIALQEDIIPILCIGDDSEKGFDQEKIISFFDLLQEEIKKQSLSPEQGNKLCIAYEPQSTIGSGTLLDYEELRHRITSIKSVLRRYSLFDQARLIYGGGITPENCKTLSAINELNGILVGTSSLDIQKLKKIVYSFI